MFDLKERLDYIIEDFVKNCNYQKVTYVVKKIRIYQDISQKLTMLVGEKLKDKSIAIYGNGKLTQELFYIIGASENIACIIDKEKKSPLYWEVEKIPIVCLEEIEKYHIDVVLIPSKIFESEMKEELRKIKFRGEIIGIHSYLEKKGCKCSKEFYVYRQEEKYHIANQVYREFLDSKTEENFFATIVGLCLIRDYVHALKMMKNYIEQENNVTSKIIELKAKIEKSFEKAREEIVRSNHKHVMMYVIDSLAQKDACSMSGLKKIMEENFSFETFMTQYIATRENVMTMLTGYQIIEQKLYKGQYFTNESGVLLPYLKKNGYKFHFFFDKRNFAFSKINDLEEVCNTNIASELFFDGLCEMLRANGNTFNYMHSHAEIHGPFYTPMCQKGFLPLNEKCSYDEFLQQFEEAKKWMDEVLVFYYQLVKSKNITQIMCGDHGIHTEFAYEDSFNQEKTSGIHRWDKDMINPVCIISNSLLGKGKNKHLVCNYSLAEIIRKILEGSVSKNELEERDDKQIKLEMLPVYGKDRINKLLNYGEILWMKGFVGIRTRKDVYVKLEDGEERYYVAGKKENLIYDENYHEVIQEYRKQLEEENGIYKILEMEKFKYHNEVMEKYKRQK